MAETDLTLELPNFEGPLDLLLHLIKSQKIDIYDIPIAEITQQYLAYLTEMKRLNLQIAGEYFVMASTLLRIKSQDLLPRNDFEAPVSEEALDPRQELVDQLVQYSVFKSISHYFKKRNEKIPLTMGKEPTVSSMEKISPLPKGQIAASELANCFVQVLHRYKLRQPDVGKIAIKQISIQIVMTHLVKALRKQGSLSFFECVRKMPSIEAVVAFFLAILELCKDRKLIVKQDQPFGDVKLERVGDDEQ